MKKSLILLLIVTLCAAILSIGSVRKQMLVSKVVDKNAEVIAVKLFEDEEELDEEEEIVEEEEIDVDDGEVVDEADEDTEEDSYDEELTDESDTQDQATDTKNDNVTVPATALDKELKTIIVSIIMVTSGAGVAIYSKLTGKI